MRISWVTLTCFVAVAASCEAGRGGPPGPAFASEVVLGSGNDWEPAIAAAPDGPEVYVLATRYGSAGRDEQAPAELIFHRSTTSGTTWEAGRSLHPGAHAQNDPQLVAIAGGVLFAAWMPAWSVAVSVSRDGGRTFAPPVSVLSREHPPLWSDKPILAAGPGGQDVYVAFNASDSWIAVSHDGAASFEAPVRTSNDGRYWFHTGAAVDPAGAVWFAAADYAQDERGDIHIQLIASVDRGRTWPTTLVDTSREMADCGAFSPGCERSYLGPQAAIAVAPGGLLMIAYNAGDRPGQPERLWVRTSSDGRVFGPRAEVSGAPPATHHAFPALAAGPGPETFHLIWQDSRRGTDGWNVWYRRTDDGGRTWSPEVRLSDRVAGAPYKNSRGYRLPFGDYCEIAAGGNGSLHAVWGEGASTAGPGGIWYAREIPR